MKKVDPLAFVEKHGVVLVSARHDAVPSFAAAIAGEPIRGSWWAHPRAKSIFDALAALAGSADVVFTRLVDGKVTMIHRRLWPAVAALVKAGKLDAGRVAKVEQVHTASGKHVSRTLPLADWLPRDLPVVDEAVALRALAGVLGTDGRKARRS